MRTIAKASNCPSDPIEMSRLKEWVIENRRVYYETRVVEEDDQIVSYGITQTRLESFLVSCIEGDRVWSFDVVRGSVHKGAYGYDDMDWTKVASALNGILAAGRIVAFVPSTTDMSSIGGNPTIEGIVEYELSPRLVNTEILLPPGFYVNAKTGRYMYAVVFKPIGHPTPADGLNIGYDPDRWIVRLHHGKHPPSSCRL